MRGWPPELRSGLPFDPADVVDVRLWVQTQVANVPLEGGETDAFVEQRLSWLAQNAGRRRPISKGAGGKKRIQFHSLSRLLCKELDRTRSPWAVLAKDGLSSLEDQAIENVVTCGLAAARRFCARHGSTSRIGRAAMSCLARVAWGARTVLSPTGLSRFCKDLMEHPMFASLPASADAKSRFYAAITTMPDTGSVRRDVSSTGCSCPGAAQWREFRALFDTEWQQRFSTRKAISDEQFTSSNTE